MIKRRVIFVRTTLSIFNLPLNGEDELQKGPSFPVRRFLLGVDNEVSGEFSSFSLSDWQIQFKTNSS